MQKYNFIKKIFLLFTLSLVAGSFVLAADDEIPLTLPNQVEDRLFAKEGADNREYHINLNKATIAKGYTVAAFEDSLKLSLVPGILSEATGVDVVELNEPMEMPWQLDRISKIYQFEFNNAAAYDNHRPFYIQFSYDEKTDNYKQVFFYDKNYNAWRPLPTKDYPEEKFVRSLIHLPYARIAVFDNPEVLAIGSASWYAYKGGNFAASPDFPKGSRIRVMNTENNKFVDVEINDHGPDRGLHPDRVIDLDKVAFGKIASLGAGVIDVKIEPLNVLPENGKVLKIASTGATVEPEISAKSYVVVNENTGETIYEKNATTTAPLASLTKLAAIKVFLDTKQSLNNAVAYSDKDAEYNYEYCEEWESARLKVDDGDTMTIEDLVYASLVGSANNTVETLVRVSGLGRDNFIAKMNETVRLWGAQNTHFVEPTGLSPDNVSSAADYAIITKEVFKNPLIQKASAMPEYKFSTLNTKKAHRIKNTNKIIAVNNFKITGSKTGYLDEAGYCLMMRALSPSGESVIVVTMGAVSRDISFNETEELLRYGLRQIE